MSNNSIIEHRANYHFLKIQEDYLTICEGDHCQALILDILEEWTNTKRKTGESLSLYMTYPQWIISLYGAYGRNRIMDALARLQSRGLVERRLYRLHGKDTFEYQLNIQEINTLIQKSSEKLEAPSQRSTFLPEAHRAKHSLTSHHSVRREGKVVTFHNKRAQMVALPATLTLDQWKRTLNDFSYKCAYCQSNDYSILEHFIPLIGGGGTTAYNCVPACAPCNRAKSDHYPTMIEKSHPLTEAFQRIQHYLEERKSEENEQ